MLKKTGLLLLIGILFFWSCTDTSTGLKYRKVQHVGILEEQLYDADAVYDYVFENQEYNYDSLKKTSRKYFLEGVDEFKNKKHFSKAISAFKRSILQYPEAVTYYELGNALLDNKEYQEAMRAYMVALKLDIEASGTLYYNMAIATLYSSDDINNPGAMRYEALNYFEKAIDNGYMDWKAIEADKRLDPLRQENRYQELYSESHALTKEEADSFHFDIYKKNFPTKTTFAMTAEQVTLFNSENYISYDYEDYVKEMRSANFGRGVSEEFYYVAKLEENSRYVILLYASVSVISDQFSPTRFIMTIYSNTGEELDKREIGQSTSVDQVRTFKWEDGELQVEDFDRTWKYDMSDAKSTENEIIDLKSTGLTEYIITPEGRFSEVNKTASAK